MKNREARTAIVMPARMRTDSGWHDATIRNVSSHGAMLQTCGRAPDRGTYIELRRDTLVFVGRIVWSTANRCGVATRERIDLCALRNPARGQAMRVGGDRRRQARTAPRPGIDHAIVRRRIEASSLLFAILCATMAIGDLAYHALQRPGVAIAAALGAAS